MIISLRTVICPSYKCCNGYSTESDADTECPAGTLKHWKNLTLLILKFIPTTTLMKFICNLWEKCVDIAAICDGQITSTGACQNTADGGLFQLIKGTKVFTSSGQCNEPEVCSNCGSGFHADGPKCKSKVYLNLFTSTYVGTNNKLSVLKICSGLTCSNLKKMSHNRIAIHTENKFNGK